MLRYGFFDSVRGDRKYNSRDVAELFDGIIVDGIYAQIGEKFSVNPKKVIETEEDKMTVTVGTGQAWLSHTKVLNTSKMEFLIAEGVGVNRYDAIIIEVNDNTRTADIFVKKNVRTKTENTATAFDLADGQLIRTEFVHQYLLAVIYIEGGTDRIRQENIASKIGFAIPGGIPYVTCPLEPFPADETLKQWVAQWDKFMTGSDTRFNNFMTGASGLFNTAQSERAAAFDKAQTQRNTDYQALRKSIIDWLNSTETDWNTWYASVKDDFEGYVDGKISDHNKSETAHPDLRTELATLTNKLNTVANSSDPNLDQLSEIVTYIKENRRLIGLLENSDEALPNHYLQLTGGTLTGPLQIKYNGDTYVAIINNEINLRLAVDDNRKKLGLWSNEGNDYNEWLLYMDYADEKKHTVITRPQTNDPIVSKVGIVKHIDANKGQVAIDCGVGNYYKMIARTGGTSGVFTLGNYIDDFVLQYTSNETISAGTNAVNYSVKLLKSNGSSEFPGKISSKGITSNGLIFSQKRIAEGGDNGYYAREINNDDSLHDDLFFGFDTGANKAGIWNRIYNKWILYMDRGTGQVYVNGGLFKSKFYEFKSQSFYFTGKDASQTVDIYVNSGYGSSYSENTMKILFLKLTNWSTTRGYEVSEGVYLIAAPTNVNGGSASDKELTPVVVKIGDGGSGGTSFLSTYVSFTSNKYYATLTYRGVGTYLGGVVYTIAEGVY